MGSGRDSSDEEGKLPSKERAATQLNQLLPHRNVGSILPDILTFQENLWISRAVFETTQF